MRINPTGSALGSRRRDPRVIVSIVYTVGSIYLTSRSGIANVPGNVVQGCVTDTGSVSQTLRSEDGAVTIGAFDFTAVDVGGAISAFLDDQLNTNGEGIRDRRVKVYTGDTDDFADGTWQQVGEYIARTSVTWREGEITISCTDLLGELGKRLFRPNKTRLTATLELADTVANVDSTDGFELVEHTASHTDRPLQTVGYLYFPKTGEISSYTDKAAGQFINLDREINGALGEIIEVEPTDDYDRRPEVVEFPYFEMPGPQLLYAVLTGTVLDTSITWPDNWHLGIDAADVDADSFRNIGADLYDASNPDGGRVFRFLHVEEVDGMRWIQEQLCLPMGCYLTISSDGKIKLKRITRVIADASPVVTLHAGRDIVSHSGLTHHQSEVINQAIIKWNWDGDDFTRIDPYINEGSIAQHQVAGHREYEFYGLSVTRHGAATIRHIFDTLVDRFGAPPISMRASISAEYNDLEVGDIVRVVDPGVRNYVTGGTLDHAFEIQSIGMDWLTGDLNVDLRGSSAETLPEPPTSVAATSLSDSWYESAGADLASVLTIDGTGNVTAGGTLTGGASMSGAVFYYTGDLTIADGVDVLLEDNVQLRVLGELTVNGRLLGIGAGPAGIANPDTVGQPKQAYQFGDVGYGLGTTRGSDGIRFANSTFLQNAPSNALFGAHPSLPHSGVTVEDGELVGYLEDLRGCPGINGPSFYSSSGGGTIVASKGGDGGNGGAGLMIVCRGLSFGVNGQIDLSGSDGTPADGPYSLGGNDYYGGAGAGGAPGGLAVFLDSSQALMPELSTTFVANQGDTPQLGTPGTYEGLGGRMSFSAYPGTGARSGLGGEDHSSSHSYVMWLPLEAELQEGSRDALPVPSIESIEGNDKGVLLTLGGVAQKVEIWWSLTPLLSDATLIQTGQGSKHQISFDGVQTRYYFVRNRDFSRVSAFDTDTGTVGTGGTPFRLDRRIVETFDGYTTAADFLREWEILAGSPTISIVQAGIDGGKVLQVTGYMKARYRRNLEYDPSRLYEASCRIRRTVAEAGQETLSVGMYGVEADGTTLIDALGGSSSSSPPNRNIVNGFDMGNLTLNEWRRAKQWITASVTAGVHNVASYPGASVAAPWSPTQVRASSAGSQAAYVRPTIECNAPAGSTATCQLDHLTMSPHDTTDVALSALPDINFTGADDDEFWSFVNYSGNPAPSLAVGAGLNGGNAMLFDIDGTVPGNQVLVTSRHALKMADQFTFALRYRFENVVSIGSQVRLTAQLQGLRLSNDMPRHYEAISGSLPGASVLCNTLVSDGSVNQAVLTLSSMFLNSYLADADFVQVQLGITLPEASDDFDFFLLRSNAVRSG